jgi:hypothetical protein
MKNPYTMLNNALMKGANAAVYAYNWTTGRTKADLANKMLTVAPILEIPGYLNSLGYGFTSALAPMCLFYTHSTQKNFEGNEQKEADSLDRDMKDLGVEKYKNTLRY